LARGLGIVSTASSHGAKSAPRSDWSPLAGKDVVILPDHDPEGEGYAKAVLRELARLQPRPRVRVVRLSDIWRTDSPIPEKGDIEEWLSEGVPEAWEPERCGAELERVADQAPIEDLDAQPEPAPAGAETEPEWPSDPRPIRYELLPVPTL